jgi:hypothetical protein
LVSALEPAAGIAGFGGLRCDRHPRGGKTQVMPRYARRRVAEGWRLAAWVDASDEVSMLAGLVLVAVAVSKGVASDDVHALGLAVLH